MSLNISLLRNGISDTFTAMLNAADDEDGNEIFAEGIMKALKAYIDSGTTNTRYAGSVPMGPIVNMSGSGGTNMDWNIGYNIMMPVLTGMNNMSSGGDAALANGFVGALQAMINQPNSVTESASGTVQVGNSTPGVAGSATGQLVASAASMGPAMNGAASQMLTMDSGGDDFMTGELVNAMAAIITSAVVQTMGTGAISGAVGTGQIS